MDSRVKLFFGKGAYWFRQGFGKMWLQAEDGGWPRKYSTKALTGKNVLSFGTAELQLAA